MKDVRYELLAKNLVEYSVALKPGEKVLLEVTDGEVPLTREIIKAAYAVGALPFLWNREPQLNRELMRGASAEQVKLWGEHDKALMEQMDAYISIRASKNVNEMAGLPAEKMKQYAEFYSKPVHFETRVHKTKWCILRYPNESMAQSANMATEDFEDFYFDVCTLDYHKMSEAMNPLKELIERTDRVQIKGPGTDLSFSIKNIGAVKCDGQLNIPDGEVYTAPVRDSVNGTVSFNAPTLYNGTTFDNIRLTFKDGKIVEATANDTEAINRILDTDEGARYIGEFSLGFNPYILKPMKDILFDEKIAGSFHLTPGNCYDDAYNGNRSNIHWDLVCIQTPEYGGGEIWFDDVLIRKDGLFVIPELEGLNPDRLK
ncbi:aminopeptidase [Tumebacillus algifaecis]|uniref:Aminopeptidase n=1 Tax=Tumebacillus algifaecis TaxID=1214604 RepID=A0A223CYR1_9BACL|nr:aminopeptidase [Tumebacillus algifaecis]ASS74395.1 aminopeptidase [Tumebacillus algifaecis]